jgi:hypothetical protein
VFFDIIAVVCAVIILALFVIGGIIRKKNVVVAIIAGLFNFLSALFLPWFVRLFHQLPIGVYRFYSSEEATAFLTNLLVKTFLFMGLSALILIGFILSIVYIASCFKSKPAIFAVGALILVIVRYLFIPPYQTILTIIFKLAISDLALQTTILAVAQSFQYILYYAILMVALLLCVLSALMNKSREAKLAKAEAAKEKAEAEAKAKAEAEAKAELKAEIKQLKKYTCYDFECPNRIKDNPNKQENK